MLSTLTIRFVISATIAILALSNANALLSAAVAAKRDQHEIALTSRKDCCSSSPRISPDGKEVVFVRNANLWTMDSFGHNQKQITHFVSDAILPLGAQSPSWNPDGTHIVFASKIADGKGGIFVVQSDGTDLRQLTFNWLDSDPDWSPDGRRIVFTSRPRLWIMGSDGRDAHALTADDTGQGEEYSAKWSRDGNRIAYVDTNNASNLGNLRVISFESGEQQSLNAQREVFHFTWSRDGASIYFPSGSMIEALDTRTGEVRDFMPFNHGEENAIDLSPDGVWMLSDSPGYEGPSEGVIYKILMPAR